MFSDKSYKQYFFLCNGSFKVISDDMLERNHVHAVSVVKLSCINLIWNCIIGYTLGKIINATNMLKLN